MLAAFAGLLGFKPHAETTVVKLDSGIGYRRVLGDAPGYLSGVDTLAGDLDDGVFASGEDRKTVVVDDYAVGRGKRAMSRTVGGGHGTEAAAVDPEIAAGDQVANDDDFAEGDEHRVRHYRPAHPESSAALNDRPVAEDRQIGHHDCSLCRTIGRDKRDPL